MTLMKIMLKNWFGKKDLVVQQCKVNVIEEVDNTLVFLGKKPVVSIIQLPDYALVETLLLLIVLTGLVIQMEIVYIILNMLVYIKILGVLLINKPDAGILKVNLYTLLIFLVVVSLVNVKMKFYKFNLMEVGKLVIMKDK